MNRHEPILDVIASGVHDAKNVIFDAKARIASARAAMLGRQPVEADALLQQADDALDMAGRGLSVALAAYRLDHGENPVVLRPTVVCDLLQEVVIRGRCPSGDVPPELRIACSVPGAWLLDRELVAESMVNALQNARRHARSAIVVSAECAGGGLCLCVEDDGPGFHATRRDSSQRFSGIGLQVAQRIAALHERNGVRGRLDLFNGGGLGGAVFALWIPG